MTLSFPRHVWLELSASFCMLCGQFTGSTTLKGAVFYAVSNCVWWIWMFGGKHWGFIPVNVLTAVVTLHALWEART